MHFQGGKAFEAVSDSKFNIRVHNLTYLQLKQHSEMYGRENWKIPAIVFNDSEDYVVVAVWL